LGKARLDLSVLDAKKKTEKKREAEDDINGRPSILKRRLKRKADEEIKERRSKKQYSA
jgi:hypothetical protein